MTEEPELRRAIEGLPSGSIRPTTRGGRPSAAERDAHMALVTAEDLAAPSFVVSGGDGMTADTRDSKHVFISPAEEAKARRFREERFREHATALERRMKLLSEISGIFVNPAERPAPFSSSAARRLEEIAVEIRDARPKRGHRA